MAGSAKGSEQNGLTRRELLKKGSMAGIGMAWVAPAVTSIEMSPALAQATSGPLETSPTTQPGQETPTSQSETTTTLGDTSTSDRGENTSTPSDGQTPSTTEGQTSTVDVESQSTSPTTGPKVQPSVGASDEVLADEVVAGALPFTGLPLEQLVPLAGGVIATGAALVRAARERKDRDTVPDSDEA